SQIGLDAAEDGPDGEAPAGPAAQLRVAGLHVLQHETSARMAQGQPARPSAANRAGNLKSGSRDDHVTRRVANVLPARRRWPPHRLGRGVAAALGARAERPGTAKDRRTLLWPEYPELAHRVLGRFATLVTAGVRRRLSTVHTALWCTRTGVAARRHGS